MPPLRVNVHKSVGDTLMRGPMRGIALACGLRRGRDTLNCLGSITCETWRGKCRVVSYVTNSNYKHLKSKPFLLQLLSNGPLAFIASRFPLIAHKLEQRQGCTNPHVRFRFCGKGEWNTCYGSNSVSSMALLRLADDDLVQATGNETSIRVVFSLNMALLRRLAKSFRQYQVSNYLFGCRTIRKADPILQQSASM